MQENNVQLVLSPYKQMGTLEALVRQLILRLERLENDVQARISIRCPVSGCPSKFTSKAHRNRHIRDWIAKKAENEHLWHEHDKVADTLKLKDEQDGTQPPASNDDAQITNLAMRSACAAPSQQHQQQQQQQQQHDISPQFRFPTYGEFEFADNVFEVSAFEDMQGIQNSTSTELDHDMVLGVPDIVEDTERTMALAQGMPDFERLWSEIERGFNEHGVNRQ